jgi:hypothetical protein
MQRIGIIKRLNRLELTMKIIPVENNNGMHCHYERQTAAQGCYVEIDCKLQTLLCSYNAEIGNAVPFAVYHGHEQRFGIPCLTAGAANDLMAQINPIADRVCAGYESVWNGNNNVARFNDDARAAIDEIEAICADIDEEGSTVVEWDAGDYLQGVMHRKSTDGRDGWYPDATSVTIDEYGTIDHTTTDDQIGEIEQKIEDDIETNVVINGLEKLLRDERDNCMQNHKRYSEEDDS